MNSNITEEEVIWMYRLLLGREPESSRVIADHISRETSVDLLRAFLQSAEFGVRSETFGLLPRNAPSHPLDQAPPMWRERGSLEEKEYAMWCAVAESWESFAQSDPYWSVLADDRWRIGKMTDAAKLDAFYATGQFDVERLAAWVRRSDLIERTDGVCAEYGCGVGRITEWLAQRYRKIRAFDISKGHIEAARRRMARRGITNVEFFHVRSPSDLEALTGCDLFFSMIVLQHNPPPIIRSILKAALQGLNPSGIAFFQVPTYMADYKFDPREYVNRKRDTAVMEMHCIPQREVFRLFEETKCALHEVQSDGLIGNYGTWISNTFLANRMS